MKKLMLRSGGALLASAATLGIPAAASEASAAALLWEVRTQTSAVTHHSRDDDNACAGNFSTPCQGATGATAETQSQAQQGQVFANARASADLRTGEIKLFTDGTPGMHDEDTRNAAASASGTLADTLLFQGFGSAPWEIGILFKVDGTFDSISSAHTSIELASGAEGLSLAGRWNLTNCAQGGTCQNIGAGSTNDPTSSATILPLCGVPGTLSARTSSKQP